MTSWLDTTYVQRYDCLRDARPSATLTLGEAFDAIVDGIYAPQIEHLRHIREVCWPETYRQAKQRLPALTFAGTFEPTRARAHIQHHSGIVHADVDHLEDEAALTALKLHLMQDSSTVYCFFSPSGAGLKYGARVAPVDTNDAYRHAWQTVCDAHQAQYNITWDPSGKDICRLCFVSDDPTCFVNPDADVFPVPAPPPPPPAPRVVMHVPYARPYGERSAERALRQAERLILESHPGQQHFARCKAAYLLGGYVAGGLLPYSDAYSVLAAAVSQTAEDIPRAMRTIEDGLQAGAARPITPEQSRPIPQMTTINAKEVPTMARMTPLNPPPKADIGPGPLSLVATEAGRYAQGLRFTCETWNGQCLGSALVQANNMAPYVAATATQHSLAPPDVERAVLDLLVAIEGLLRSRSRQPTHGAPPLPEIELTPEITAVADQAEAALMQTHGLRLFEHSRRLVTLAAGVKPPRGLTRPEGVPLISPVTVPRLTELASQAARFYMPTEDGRAYYRPPAWLIHTLLARTERPFFPLEAIVHAPTIRPDGSLLGDEGYDEDTGLYLDLGGMQYPQVSQAPSRDNARNALAILKDPLRDVPFADPCHLSATLAMTLTLICRHFVLSSIPLGGITAHGQGAGKGLLATVIALIGTGRPCAFWPQPIDEVEEKKRLLAIGLQGDSVVCIDNVTKPFGSGTFANVITSMTYADRILGVSQNAEVRFHCVWLATGNNLVYQADMSRRVLPIIIDPKVEHPEQRTGFTYPDLPGHVLSQRSALVTAALTIMLAYVQAGCPRQTTRAYGSFDDWYQKIAGALMWLGEPDPCEGRKALQAEVEDELLSFRQLVLCWEACYRATLATPRTLKQVAFEIKTNADPQAPNAWDDLREALGAFDPRYDGQHLDTRPAGYALRKYRGRVIEDKRFVSDPHTKAGAPWHIEMV